MLVCALLASCAMRGVSADHAAEIARDHATKLDGWTREAFARVDAHPDGWEVSFWLMADVGKVPGPFDGGVVVVVVSPEGSVLSYASY